MLCFLHPSRYHWSLVLEGLKNLLFYSIVLSQVVRYFLRFLISTLQLIFVKPKTIFLFRFVLIKHGSSHQESSQFSLDACLIACACRLATPNIFLQRFFFSIERCFQWCSELFRYHHHGQFALLEFIREWSQNSL